MNKIKTSFLLFFLFVLSILAQEKSFSDLYTKSDFMIEMRDGVKLYTVVYSPKDTSEKYPILMTRTPYSSGPYQKDKFRRFPKHLVNEKFIFVYQDVRGKFMSEGKYVNMRPYIPNKRGNEVDESSDTYDTIDWLVKNIPNNNGNVGIYGISYPGFYSALSLNDSHPALKAVSPQAPISDWFVGDDMHHNGAFTLSLSYVFFSAFGISRPEPTTKWTRRMVDLTGDSYGYFLNIGSLKNVNEKFFHGEISFWNDIVKHGTYDGFWKSRNTLNYFDKVTPAVMTVGGWFDGEDLYGALNTYKTIERKNPNAKNYLVMGPWVHGGWARSMGNSLGDIKFDSNTSEFYRENIELKFFNYYLKGKGEENFPDAMVFETGGNKWNNFDEWPPKNTEQKSFYLNSESRLTTAIQPKTEAFKEYVSNPNNPVPYSSKFHRTGQMYYKPYLVEDQRFADARPDVISFTSDVLSDSVLLAGPIEVELFASTSGTDADWVVKLIDVYPDTDKIVGEDEVTTMANYQMLVRGDIMRGKFREGLDNPKPFVPNKVAKIKFTMNDSFHLFKKGHKIMVQIQSSWFPLFDRNPQKFCDIYNAEDSDFQKATQRIYFSEKYPSQIILNVLK